MRWTKKSEIAKSGAGVASSKEPLVPPLRNEQWRLFLNNALCGVLILAVVVFLPCALYIAVFSSNSREGLDTPTCQVLPYYRVRCVNGVNEEQCKAMGCCWNATECFHSVPSQHGYSVSGWTGSDSLDRGRVLNLQTSSQLQTPQGTSMKPSLTVSATAVSPDHLRLQFSEPNAASTFKRKSLTKSRFRVIVGGPEHFSLQVLRREGSQMLLSTIFGPIIASNDYWEVTLTLPKTGAIFGLGTLGLSGRTQNVVRVLYNRENEPDAQPFILYLDYAGRAHGILIHTKSLLEVELLPSNLLILRALFPWDISVFAGPTPGDVYTQMSNSISALTIPSPWAFGLHVCRDTDDWEQDVKKFTKTAEELALPYESDCVHERLLTENLDFTISSTAQEALVTIRDAGRRVMLSLPPHVSPNLAKINPEIMVQGENQKKPLEEKYDNRLACYLDVEHPNSSSWLMEQLSSLNISKDVQISGYVLQDNWPAATPSLDPFREDLPYIPQILNNSLSNGTLWWQARHYGDVPHIRVHNDYGRNHARSILQAYPDALVLSASTTSGSGSLGGSHRQRGVRASWLGMNQAFLAVLGLGLAGVPLASGGPVCGSGPGEYDEDLCIRWYWLSSLLPLMRVSSSAPLRDPTSLNSPSAQKAATEAARFRYSLLPYFLWISHLAGPIARPMFFNWPEDRTTWYLDEQFMVGPALLVRPVFVQEMVKVEVYLPDEEPWYHFNGGLQVFPTGNGSIANVSVLQNDIIILIRGGYIVPTQEPQTTVKKTIAGNYTFVAALSQNGDAEGEIHHHFDDSSSSYLTFQIEVNETTLRVQNISGACSSDSIYLDTMVLYGTSPQYGVPRVTPADTCIIGQSTTVKPGLSANVTRIEDIALDLCCSGEIFLEWS